MNKYCIWQYTYNNRYGSSPVLFRYSYKRRYAHNYKLYVKAVPLKLPEDIPPNRLKIINDGLYINIYTMNECIQYGAFWCGSENLKIKEVEEETDEIFLLKYELGIYNEE